MSRLHRIPGSWRLLPIAATLLACAPPGESMDGSGPVLQAISFLDDSLVTLPLADSVRSRYEAQLAEAKAAYDHAPTDVDSIIWYELRRGDPMAGSIILWRV